MASNMRQSFRESSLFHAYKNFAAPTEYAWWRLRGSPGPHVPHLVKQRVIAEYAHKFDLHILFETGTNYSHMVYVNKDQFREIYSIEMMEWKVNSARQKFAGHPNIHLYQGDSGKVLPEVIPSIKEPCLFWLDAHDADITTPIKEELDAIYRHPIQDHVLLIDDACWFDGRTQYPTMEALRATAARDYPGRVVELKDNIIRIHKPQK